MKNLRQNFKQSLLLCAGLLLSVSVAVGQYAPERITGYENIAVGLPAAPNAADIGAPGALAIAPNGDMAWADYWNGGLIYWDKADNLISTLIPRGTANTGFGGPASAATTGDRIFGVAFDKDNNLYFSARNQVMKVDHATGILSLVAGSGSNDIPDFNLPATEVDINGAAALAFNHDDSKLYINMVANGQPNGNMVLAMDMASNTIERIAGTGYRNAETGATGLGLNTQIREPFGLTYVKDPADGNEYLYIATQQKRIYKYDIQTKIVSSVANINGSWAHTGDGGPAINAALMQPHALVVAPDNSALYFGDHANDPARIRRIDLKSGMIDRFAGTGTRTTMATDVAGNRLEVGLSNVIGLAFDADGNLVFAERSQRRIYKIDMTTNEMSVIAGANTPGPGSDAMDMRISAWGVHGWGGNPYFFDVTSSTLLKLENDGTTSVFAGTPYQSGFIGDTTLAASQFGQMRYIIRDSEGMLYASDIGHHAVYKIDPVAGTVTVIAGTGSSGYDAAQDGGLATAAKLNQPHGIALNPSETRLYISDLNNRRIRVVDLTTGIITTFAGTGENGETNDPTALLSAKIQAPRDLVVTSDGAVYVATSQHKKIYKLDSIADQVTVLTPKVFNQPFGLHLDEANNTIWAADNGTVKKVDLTTGNVETVANDVPGAWDIFPLDGDIYVTGQANGMFKIALDIAGPLAIIQGYAEANDATALTIAQLTAVGASPIDVNLAAYKTAVADSTAATLPYLSSVQALVNNVNAAEESAVITAINSMAVANDAAALTIDHLLKARVSNVKVTNLASYQAAVAAAAGVADKAALQALVNAANAGNALSMINAMAVANNADDLNFTMILAAGATAANVIRLNDFDYLPYYKQGVAGANGVATTAELDTILVIANKVAAEARVANALTAINAMAVANDAAALEFAQMVLAGADVALINYDFLEYYIDGVEAATGVADAAALNAIITAANTAGADAEAADALVKINAMAVANDASDLTLKLLTASKVGKLKLDITHFGAYQGAIEEATGVADLAALQAIVDGVNLELAIAKIMAFANANDASTMTVEDLAAAGVNPQVLVVTYLDFYKEAIAEVTGADVDTSAEIEAIVVAANVDAKDSAIAAIIAMSTAGDASTLTVDLLTQAGLTFEAIYLDAYKLALTTSGTLADEAAIQTLLTFTATCETVKAMAGSEDVKNLTTEMLDILGIENVFAIIFTEAYYSDAIFELDTLENCAASIQEVIDATNFMYIQEMAEFEFSDELTAEMLVAVGVEDVNTAFIDDYKVAVEGAGTIADLAALQALIDAVNEANKPVASVKLNVKMKHWADFDKFVPSTDFVDVAGSFNNWGDPLVKLAAVEPADEFLTYTITIEDLDVAVEYSFKFRINGSWDNNKHEFPNDGPARKITLVEGANEFTYWFNDEDPTSVNDVIHAGLKLYPNPAKETLTITSAVTISEIRMINSVGQVVYSNVVENDNVRIPVQRFENGIYLVQIVTNAGISVERVMINH